MYSLTRSLPVMLTFLGGVLGMLQPVAFSAEAVMTEEVPALHADAPTIYNDEVVALRQLPSGTCVLEYVWGDPAVVQSVSVTAGDVVRSGREMCILKVKHKDLPARSKATITAGATYEVEEVNIAVGQAIEPGTAKPLLRLRPILIVNDSVQQTEPHGLGSMSKLFNNLWRSTGIRELIVQTGNDWSLGIGRLIMMFVGILLLYLAIVRKFEPLLLVPIGFGAIMVNIPLANLAGPTGILGYLYTVGIETGVFPLLIFMGVGAMTDFGPLIANPVTALLGAAAQFGIFTALLGAVALSLWVPGIHFSLQDAASIGIIGGADGPTSIFLAGKLSPSLLGAIAVAAYSYMALVPIIQPPIMRLFTTPEERRTKMRQLRPVSRLEKICFPIGITLLCALLLPDAAPLISMLMFGNLLRESGVVERLNQTAQNALINSVTIFLGLTVGSKLSADKFLNLQTLGILMLGLLAFVFGTAGGLLLGKLMHRLSGGRINPLIGAAGVSAVPMAARVVNKVGLDEDPHNFLLMHAMGPNVAGVIGSAVAAGILLNALG
jgi:sodium ion-translocating decarboxylase beta subunit